MDKNYRLIVNVFQKTFAVFLKEFVLYIGNNSNLFLLFDRQLRFHIEASNAVDFVAKKLYSVRIVIRKRKYVDNSSTNRKFAWFSDKIDSFEFVFEQDFIDKINRNFVSNSYFQGVLVQLFSGYHFLEKRFGITNYYGGFFSGIDAIQNFGTKQNIRIISFFNLIRTTIGTGIKKHVLFANHLF